MKKIVLFAGLALMMAILLTSCKKDETTSGDKWNLNVSVDLGGTFPVIAVATINITGTSFSAAVTTSQIGGAAEVHDFTINGTANGNTLTVTNAVIVLTYPTFTETITLNGTIVISGNTLSGNGTESVVQSINPNPEPGTFTLTGTKQ